TSSYGILLAEEIQKRGLKSKLKLKKGVFGSERWSETTRERIRKELVSEIYDIYGLTEIYGPGIGITCDEDDGIHYWDDFIYIEVIDPITGKPVEDGEDGEIVITTLVKEGAPLLRFRTHDLSRIIPGKCKCGSCYPRIDTIKGRSDDMFKVRGVNMFPKQVEELLAQVEGTSSEYAIRIAREEGTNKDVMLLTVECDGKYDFNQISAQIMEKFKALIGMTPNKVIVVPIGTLPRSEKKTKRVTDDRKL
ncbi:MAG: AMP-binding protein, partial [Oscillospiraceae bacterium]|nr:AMP-binding protein [Oscillospiraceae bacterium]